MSKTAREQWARKTSQQRLRIYSHIENPRCIFNSLGVYIYHIIILVYIYSILLCTCCTQNVGVNSMTYFQLFPHNGVQSTTGPWLIVVVVVVVVVVVIFQETICCFMITYLRDTVDNWTGSKWSSTVAWYAYIYTYIYIDISYIYIYIYISHLY